MFDKTRQKITEPINRTVHLAVTALLVAITALIMVVFS